MVYRSWTRARTLKVAQSYGNGHWDTFEQFRQKHNENICAETNKLVLRLDKLVNPEDGNKPDLDKSIVEWTSDELVKLCPFCAKAFNLTRRRHHCRACGAILCNNCSKFLDYRSACRLVRPAKLYTDPYDRIEDRLKDRDAEEKPKIRTCEDCKRLLDKRIQVLEDHYSQPTFHDFYLELRKLMSEADELNLSYNTLLSDNKKPTVELKSKMVDLKHKIAMKSTKLNKMIQQESGKQAHLLNSISQSVGCWLKETIESREDRLFGARQRESTSGWVPEKPVGITAPGDEDNPLLIQIKNLEAFIEQAKKADRFEEVSVLEDSKRDLEIEYLIQKDLTI